MNTLTIDTDTEKQLAALSRLTGKTAPDVLRDAISAYLEDLEDAAKADAVLDRIEDGSERTLSLDELEKRLALGG